METVIRLRAGTTSDRYNSAVDDWTDPDELEINSCAVAPRLDSEDRTNGRQGVIVGLTVYAPAGADILATDRVRVRGDDYEVDGEPGDWRSPYGTANGGLEIALRRVEG